MENNNNNINNNIYIGAHSSIAKGYFMSVKSIYAMGGNSVQIFLKNPRGRIGKDIDENDAKQTLDFVVKNKIFLVGHCSYLLNFAKDPNEYQWAVSSLIDDMQRVSKIGGKGVVLHIGKYLDMTSETAYNNIIKSVNLVLDKTPKNVNVIFENTAGQGTEIGYKFEELKKIYDLFDNEQKKRITFCLDTCHSHAAGYNLSTKEGVNNWINEFDKNIGVDKLECIHLNDAKKDSGSKVDRHEDLTYGTIGKIGLKEVTNFAKNNNIPMILETPTNNISYLEQINMVKNNFN